MGVKVKGLSSLQVKLAKLDPVTRGALGIGVKKAGLMVEGAAKHNLTINKSVDTGNLRGSVHTSGRSTKNGAEATVGTNVEYAPYVEFGTSRSRAKPYLQPALQKNKDKARKLIMTEIVKAHKGLSK